MSELMPENTWVEDEGSIDEKEEYFNGLMETYEQIPDKGNLEKEERDLREKIMGFLYHEKKMRDGAIAVALQVSERQVGTWRRKEGLATNKKNKMVKEEKPPIQKRGDYYRSPEEIEKVVRFVLKAQSVIKEKAEGSKKEHTSLRKILDPKS
jgi:hypothetical protein